MSEPYTPAAVAPTFPLTLPLDGEVINHAILVDGMIKPTLDYAAYAAAAATNAVNAVAVFITNLAKQTASSGDTLVGVLTYPGGSLTLPTGTLRTALAYIADNAAKLSGANSFTGTNSFTAFNGTLNGPLVTRTSTISPGLGVVIDTAVESYIWATPTAQQDVDVSATSTVPRIGSTIWVTRPSTGAFSIIIHRVGQVGAIVTLPGSTECGALLVWVGDGAGNGRWRLGYSTTGATPGADA